MPTVLHAGLQSKAVLLLWICWCDGIWAECRLRAQQFDVGELTQFQNRFRWADVNSRGKGSGSPGRRPCLLNNKVTEQHLLDLGFLEERRDAIGYLGSKRFLALRVVEIREAFGREESQYFVAQAGA